MGELTDSDISRFWRWFTSVCSEFGDHFENAPLVQELDSRIAELGEFSWELGPAVGSEKENALVITPCGSEELLLETRRVVSIAPPCPHWEFHFAKPPKKWDLEFSLIAEDGCETEVNASSWRYMLYKFPDGSFDIVMCIPGSTGLSDNLKLTAAEIVLDGELGEEARITLIKGIELVNEFEHDVVDKSNPIKDLASHLRALSPGAFPTGARSDDD